MKLLGALLLAAAAGSQTAHGKKKFYGKAKKFAIPAIPVIPAPVPVRAPFFQADYTCTEPTTTCPPGFVLEGNVCVQPITHPSRFVCSVGTLQHDVCISTAPTIPECQHGYVLRGDQCVTTITAPSIPYCPEGYFDDGTCCTKNVPAPVIDICTVGTRVGDSCCETHSTAPSVNTYCPEGFEEENGECCRIETYDCTPADARPLECGDDEECIARLRYLKGKKGIYFGHGKGYGKGKFHHVAPVLHETAVIQQTCQKKIVEPMIRDVFCAVGELVGNACITKEYFPLTQKCTVGGDPFNCFTTQTAAYLYQCPEGYDMAGRQCTTSQVIAPMPTCPHGLELAGDHCLRTTPAEPICEIGTLGHDGYCHDKEFEPPTTTWCVTCVGANCEPRACGVQFTGKYFGKHH